MGIMRWLFGRSERKVAIRLTPEEASPVEAPKLEPTEEDLQLRKFRGEYDWINAKQAEILLHPDEDGRPPLRLKMRRDSLCLFEETTGAPVSSKNRHLWKLGIWGFNIRGSAYYPEAVRDGDLRPGRPVNLVREPENEYDPNAIRICAHNSPETVGYVNKGNARMLAKRLDAGEPLIGIALNGDRPGIETGHGIGVLITDPETMDYLKRKS